MFRDPPALLAGVPVDDQGGDAFRHGEVAGLAGRLEGRHQGFGEVHVGVLAAVIAQRAPVGRELFPCRAGILVPEPLQQHLRHVGEQPVGIGVADDLGGGGRQHHEGVPVGPLLRHRRARIVDAPQVPATVGVAVALPQEPHAVVDVAVRARQAEEMGDREAMDQPGGVVDLPLRPRLSGARGVRRAVVGEGEEAAARVPGGVLEQREQRHRLAQEPLPVDRAVDETRACRTDPALGRRACHPACHGACHVGALLSLKVGSRSVVRPLARDAGQDPAAPWRDSALRTRTSAGMGLRVQPAAAGQERPRRSSGGPVR